MDITYFDRHSSMNMGTLSSIRDLNLEIFSAFHDAEAEGSRKLENMLCGLYDGYDYSAILLNSEEFATLKTIAPQTATKVEELFATVAKYPRTEVGNNGNW